MSPRGVPKHRYLLDPMQAFHTAFGVKGITEMSEEERERTYRLRASLLLEETLEAMEALGYSVTNSRMVYLGKRFPLEDLAKELSDVVVIAAGTAEILQIPLEACYAEVMESNMSKLDADGRPIYREDGKVLKSDRYRPPNIRALME